MKKIFLVLSLLFAFHGVYAQEKAIYYEVSFPNAVHHEAQISMTISNVPVGPLKVRMSRSSPGRYATHEFGKNIYHLKAYDEKSNLLAVNLLAGDEYEIPTHGKSVKITYTIFGNWIDGTYTGFDETHAHMNIPATFAYPIGMDQAPRMVKFNFEGKKDWRVATQLQAKEKDLYYAPNLQYFMDSPIEIAAWKTASWSVAGADGKTQTIHVVSHSNDDQETIDKYAAQVKKLVAEQAAIWGELPKFDYGNYYFLHDVHPEYAGDGMEHRNSTVIVQRTPKIAGYEPQLLGTFSHEFFHAWNVERFRPKTLEPFKFEHSNVSESLWFAEGFTHYYGILSMARAGFRSLENTLPFYGSMVNSVLNSPGALNFSPIESSRYAVFADAGVAIDQTNQSNIFTSYYTYGAMVALALDLRLRADFKLTLDDYMRALWKNYGKAEMGYTTADLQKTLAEVTKNPSFATAFFKDYVYGTAKNDYAKLLLNAGIVLRKTNPGKAYAGFGGVHFENGKAILGQTIIGTPAYKAGLDADQIILTIDGVEIKDQAGLSKITDSHQPGDAVTITYSYHGEAKTTKLTFVENPTVEIVMMERTGGVLTPAMQNFRDNWLKSQVK